VVRSRAPRAPKALAPAALASPGAVASPAAAAPPTAAEPPVEETRAAKQASAESEPSAEPLRRDPEAASPPSRAGSRRGHHGQAPGALAPGRTIDPFRE
jgi:hypothetical protein